MSVCLDSGVALLIERVQVHYLCSVALDGDTAYLSGLV